MYSLRVSPISCLPTQWSWRLYGKSLYIVTRPQNLLPKEAYRYKSLCTEYCCGPDSSVGIATDWAGRSGDRIPVGARFSAPVQTGPGAHPASCAMGTGSFPGVKCDRGVLLTTHPLLVPRSWKSIAIPLPTLWATPGL
jgi:hypothetical protein